MSVFISNASVNCIVCPYTLLYVFVCFYLIYAVGHICAKKKNDTLDPLSWSNSGTWKHYTDGNPRKAVASKHRSSWCWHSASGKLKRKACALVATAATFAISACGPVCGARMLEKGLFCLYICAVIHAPILVRLMTAFCFRLACTQIMLD